MHRFFVRPEDFTSGEVVLRGSDVSHIRTVLRLKPGERIQVLDGLGNRYCVCLTEVKPKEIRGQVESKEAVQTESPLNLRMGLSLLKGNKFDPILRKAVELGVRSVVPLRTERCVVRVLRTEEDKKIARWEKIAREAAKQSGRTELPAVHPRLQSVENFCHECRDFDVKIIFWEEEEETRLKDIHVENSPRSIAFLTGPEGGFSRQEIEAAKQSGFQPVSLGPRILRAETAPVVVLSLLQNRWGDL